MMTALWDLERRDLEISGTPFPSIQLADRQLGLTER
jgi:hypothetical protein